MIYECENCGKRSRKLDTILMSDWLRCQDPADVIGLPVGECPKCYAPVYHPDTFARIAAARQMLAALRDIATLAEFGTTGPGKCRSDQLTAEKATALRLSISDTARAAIAAAAAAGIKI